MPTELPKQYDPKEAQQRWLTFWNEQGYFHSRPDPKRKPYTHRHPAAQRHRRPAHGPRAQQHAAGRPHPLAAHAGLQRPVDARHRPRRHRHAGRGRAPHLRRRRRRPATTSAARSWSSASGSGRTSTRPASSASSASSAAAATGQRTRFTLDAICARAVRQTFFNLFNDGLIFRGKRLVNWDTHLQTAVADDEIFHRRHVKGGFWTFKLSR